MFMKYLNGLMIDATTAAVIAMESVYAGVFCGVLCTVYTHSLPGIHGGSAGILELLQRGTLLQQEVSSPLQGVCLHLTFTWPADLT